MRRRQFLATSGFLGMAWPFSAHRLLAATASGKTKRCLVLWMAGGPSQFETVDPKPGAETGGPTRAIATRVPGLQLAHTLPQLATKADELVLLRNISSPEGEHERATYRLHTGFTQVPGFPRPSLGSVVSHAAPELPFPKHVTLGGPGFGPAFLGLEHAPFAVERPDEAREMLTRLDRRRGRIELIESLGRAFDRRHVQPAREQRAAMLKQLGTLAGTPFVAALDSDRASQATRHRYGEGRFAENCLVARRLLEAGVSYVEVRHQGWDTHTDNFAVTRRLCEEIDRPCVALLDDLRSSGLLDDTLVIWLGEFGRTPVINANGGRDHFPDVTPVWLAGAGLNGGQVIGATSTGGTTIEGTAHGVADLFATIFAQLGISPETEFTTAFGAPTTITDEGQVIPFS